MPWAKLHTDMLGDPKLSRAFRAGAKGLELTPWLILFAKLADDDGRLSVGPHGATPEDIAALIPGNPIKLVASCEAGLESVAVLIRDHDGVLRFARWQERQGKGSQTREAVAERVRKHRERRKEGVTVTPPVTRTEGCYVTQEERREEEKREEETPPRYDRLLSKLPNVGGTRWAITEFLEKVPGGRYEGWMVILAACLDGMDMPGGRPCTAEQLATTCRDFMTKPEHDWNPKFFRDCVGVLMRQAARSIGKAPSAERESRSFEVARTWTPPKDPAA